MKKTILSIAALSLAATMIMGGCSSTAPQSSTASSTPQAENSQESSVAQPAGKSAEGQSLTIWVPPFGTEDVSDQKFWEESLAPLSESSGAKISVEITPWDNYEQKYLTAIASKTGPDVGYMYMEMISDFIDMGALTPMDEYLTQADKDTYVYLDKGFIKGGQYMLPLSVGNVRVLFCNMDILNAAGITETPKTWDDLIKTCQAIKEKCPDKDPILLPWGDGQSALNAVYYPPLLQAGGDFFDKDGKLSITTPEALEAAQFLYDMKFKYDILPEKCTSMKASDTSEGFAAGTNAMVIMGNQNAAKYTTAGINWDYTASLMGKQRGTFSVADSLVLMSACENKELAMDAMRMMTSIPTMEKFHTDISQQAPINKGEKYLANPKFQSMFEEDKEILNVLPAVSGSAKVYDMLYKNLQLMIQGQLTPQQALDDTAKYAETVLK